jgi:hypothetical protein
MSHNLHFLVVRAESPEDACQKAEERVFDFGNENNWRTICGCVSEKNEVFSNDESGRYSPEQTGYKTIEKINKVVKRWCRGTIGTRAEEKLKRAKAKINLKRWNSLELFSLERIVHHLYQVKNIGVPVKEFNVLEHNFFPCEYTECGVTQFDDEVEKDNESNMQIFVVFLDMHD